MKITRVEASWLQVPIPAAQQHVSDFGRATTFDTALVRIDTDARPHRLGRSQGLGRQHRRLSRRGAR